MMPALTFEPVTARNRRAFIDITRETLWCPAWPGDAAAVREFDHGPDLVRRSARLIYDGPSLVGRAVLPLVADWLIVRDLGLRDMPGLGERAAGALLDLAARQGAAFIRTSVHDPYWPPLASHGLVEQKRRTTMRRDLRGLAPVFQAANARPVRIADRRALGRLLLAAYSGTVDDEGEDVDVWSEHVADIMRGQFGPFLPAASFVTPAEPPFHSVTLVVESAPGYGVLGQVATAPEHANRGQARRLIGYSLAALSGAGCHTCFLEVTLSNANALHLYSTLGFEPLGPQIVYGYKRLAG